VLALAGGRRDALVEFGCMLDRPENASTGSEADAESTAVRASPPPLPFSVFSPSCYHGSSTSDPKINNVCATLHLKGAKIRSTAL
jgi:hypothetical protein